MSGWEDRWAPTTVCAWSYRNTQVAWSETETSIAGEEIRWTTMLLLLLPAIRRQNASKVTSEEKVKQAGSKNANGTGSLQFENSTLFT